MKNDERNDHKTKEDAENGNPEAILYLARETESASAWKRKREENVVEVQVTKAKNKDDHARSREAKRKDVEASDFFIFWGNRIDRSCHYFFFTDFNRFFRP